MQLNLTNALHDRNIVQRSLVHFKAVLKDTCQDDWSVFSSTAYQGYKKFAGGSAEADSEAPALEAGDDEPAKQKDFALENGAFEFCENGIIDEKSKGIDKNTQLWD